MRPQVHIVLWWHLQGLKYYSGQLANLQIASRQAYSPCKANGIMMGVHALQLRLEEKTIRIYSHFQIIPIIGYCQ